MRLLFALIVVGLALSMAICLLSVLELVTEGMR